MATERLRTATLRLVDGATLPLAWDYASSALFEQHCLKARDGWPDPHENGNLWLMLVIALRAGARLSGLEPQPIAAYHRLFELTENPQAAGNAQAAERALAELNPGAIPLPMEADAYPAGEEDEPWRG